MLTGWDLTIFHPISNRQPKLSLMLFLFILGLAPLEQVFRWHMFHTMSQKLTSHQAWPECGTNNEWLDSYSSKLRMPTGTSKLVQGRRVGKVRDRMLWGWREIRRRWTGEEVDWVGKWG